MLQQTSLELIPIFPCGNAPFAGHRDEALVLVLALAVMGHGDNPLRTQTDKSLWI